MAVSLRAGLSRAWRCWWVLARWVPVWGRRTPKSAGSRAQRKAGGAKSSELSAAIPQAARAVQGQLACASGNGRGEQVSNFRTGVRVG